MFPGITSMTQGIGPVYDAFVVDTVGPSSLSSSHTFNGVNFGPDYTNRVLLVYVLAQGKTAGQAVVATQQITGFTVGGVTGDIGATLNFWYFTGSTASSIFSAVQSDSFRPRGTSGTISFNTTIALVCSVVVISMTGSLNNTSGTTNGTFTNTSPASNTLDLQNNATLVVAGVQNSSATLTLSGSTKVNQFSHVAGYQCVYGIDSHLPSQTARAISMTGSSGATAVITDGWIW